CFLWCYAIAFYISLAQEGESKKRTSCYMAAWSYKDRRIHQGWIQEVENPYFYCVAKEYFYNLRGTRFDYIGSSFGAGELIRPISENPVGCELIDRNTSLWCPKDEEEFSQHDGYLYLECYCNQSPICATQPETFESALNALNRSDVPYCARKAGEILVGHLRAGEIKSNAAEVQEKFMATSSTTISATKATSAEPSTTAGTRTATTETTTTTSTSTLSSEFSTTATSTSSSEFSTTFTSTSPTEISTTATSTSPTESSTIATSTTSTEVSTTFATTSDYEYSDTSTTFAYVGQNLIPDEAAFTTSKTEDAEQEQMYSLLGQYGLAILVVCAISLIVIIAIIPVMLRDGKRKKHVEGAGGEGGTSKITGSRETSNEWSREGKTKEGGSKEVMTLSKEPVTLSKDPVTLSK
ncbi:hypothetical protein V3C99_003725, partial [Haemonchus contortus]